MRLEPSASHVARIATTLLDVELPPHVAAALDRIEAAMREVEDEEAIVQAWLDEVSDAMRALGSAPS